ncbi:MAG: arginase family protein, partial [Rhizobiaceae bacterium]|nr:arginase family protein [Rhizobiaceae bacterium]
IGIRTHAPQDFGIEIIYGDDLEEMNADEVSKAIIKRVGSRPVYLTFDIDCLDPAFAPGTGTPVAGGPSSAKMLSIIRRLGGLDIKGADVVEVAPAYDHSQVSAIAGATVLMYMLGLQAEKLRER